MSKLDDLLQKLCPNGVEYKEISECCYFQNGYGFDSSSFKKDGVPVLRITNIQNDIINTNDLKYVNTKDYNIDLEKFFVKKNNIVIAMSGATTGKVGINKTSHDFLLNQRVGMFLPNKNLLNNYFLYYYLLTQTEYLYNSAGGGAQPNLSTKTIQKLLIPVPPLEVQSEIVRIMDNFTELTAELTAELSARRKQYEYYRDSLLTFGDDVPHLKLKDIAQYSKDRIDATEVDKETYIGVDNLLQNRQGKEDANYLPTSGRLTKYSQNNILIGNIRPYLKKIWFSNNSGGTNGDVLVIQVTNKDVNPRYLYNVLCSEDFFKYDVQNSKGAKMPRGDKNAVLNYLIPIPSLEEQERIVSILDRFDTLCNDLTSGLPAEIEARQKQYEYYRDKLLDFKKAE